MSRAKDVKKALETAREIAECVLAPRAQAADQADSPPADSIRLLAESGLLGFTTPARYGGFGASGAQLREYTEILAAACGVTAFVQGQHQSAALLIAGGDNEELRQEMLPRLAAGEILCGVAFSHLRRTGEPALMAREEHDGFAFDGVAPWVTGWPLIREVLLGGTLPDGRFTYVVAPLNEGPNLKVSPPMPLCAMNASGTVSVTYREFRVPKSRHLKTITREQMAQSDTQATLGVTSQPFGVARAAIRLLRDLGIRRRNPQFAATADALESDLGSLRRQVEHWIGRTSEEVYRGTALELRARAITHGVRCAHAALAASGGRGNALDQPAQRLFREAMFYTLTAQTPAVQRATLDELGRMSSDSS